MNSFEQQRFDSLYQQHLTNLTLQGKRPATIDAYSHAIRRALVTTSSALMIKSILPIFHSKGKNSQTQTNKIRTLPAIEFLWLVLEHVLPKGLRRVRTSC